MRARNLSVARPGLGINVGNPHVVVALASEEELASADLTYIPILDPEPADGANIEFVVPLEPLVKDGVGRIRMRVHERGSGETLSCGTGAVAAALATRYWAGPARRTSGASRCPAELSAFGCSRPKTASTSRSAVPQSWSIPATSPSERGVAGGEGGSRSGGQPHLHRRTLCSGTNEGDRALVRPDNQPR